MHAEMMLPNRVLVKVPVSQNNVIEQIATAAARYGVLMHDHNPLIPPFEFKRMRNTPDLAEIEFRFRKVPMLITVERNSMPTTVNVGSPSFAYMVTVRCNHSREAALLLYRFFCRN